MMRCEQQFNPAVVSKTCKLFRSKELAVAAISLFQDCQWNDTYVPSTLHIYSAPLCLSPCLGNIKQTRIRQTQVNHPMSTHLDTQSGSRFSLGITCPQLKTSILEGSTEENNCRTRSPVGCMVPPTSTSARAYRCSTAEKKRERVDERERDENRGVFIAKTFSLMPRYAVGRVLTRLREYSVVR